MFGSLFQKKNDPASASTGQDQTTGQGQQPPAQQAQSGQPQSGDGTVPADQSQAAPSSSTSGESAPAGGNGTDQRQAASDASTGAAPNEQQTGDPAASGQQPASSDQPQQQGGDTASQETQGDALSHLDPRTTRVLTHAQEEAKRIKQQNTEPDQLLIGILHDEQIFKSLESMSVNAGELSKEIQSSEKMGVYQGQPTLSQTSQEVFVQAYRDSKMRGANFVSPEDVFVVLFDPKYTTSKILQAKGMKKEAVIDKFANNPALNYSRKTVLEKYAIDLTEQARAGKLDPVAGRDKEIDRMVHIISRRTKNNPIIIGETGVGKTAIVEGMAQKIVDRAVPKDLLEKRIFQLDLASLIAGASHRGEFEERLRSVINEVLNSGNKVVLFIDEIHTLLGAGEGEGMNAANLIKPYLARGQLQIIGATTTTEYRKNFEKDKAFERRFQPVIAEEPSEDMAFEMLKILRPKYEKFHNVTLPDDAIKQCIKLSKKYIGERYLPDKAIDLLDEACAEVKLQRDKGKRQDNAVKKTDIEIVVSAWTGIPVTKLTEDESQKLLKLEERIHQRLIDQQEAVSAVSEAVRRGRIGLASGSRPIASFVFLGPTGVGKTELAKTLAELLFGRDDSMARLDMSEYMEKHEVAKLIGAPPGYVGYEEGGQLTEAVRKKPYSIVLLDEIEKAHPDVFNLLLQLLEDGRLTDNKGNTISFKNTIVICTSNIGSALIQKQLGVGDKDVKKTPEEFENAFKQLQTLVREELIKFFRPELLNRFDEVVIFRPLMPEHMAGIARLGIKKTADLLKEQGFNLQITEKAVAQLARDGYDPVYGARPLRRLIQTAIENPIALAIISKKFTQGDTIVIDFNTNINEFFFHKGNAGAVEPLTDEGFKIILQKIAHPEVVTSLIDRQNFTELHSKVEVAKSKGNALAASILTVSDATNPMEIQRIRKELQTAKVKGDALAAEILECADTYAQKIQVNTNLRKVIQQLINPTAMVSGEKREVYLKLHDKLVEETKSNNPLAIRILAVTDNTPSDVIEQLMEDIKKGKEDENELAVQLLSVINNEIAQEAEHTKSANPAMKFKRVLKQLINPLYAASPDNKEKFSQIYENLNKANLQGNSLAASLLAMTDITSDADISRLRDELLKAQAQGDPMAKEILEAIDGELKLEPLRKLKSSALLIVNPLAAETPKAREDLTVMQSKITEASQKGSKLAAGILAITEGTSMDDLQKVKELLDEGMKHKDEVALLISDAAGIRESDSVSILEPVSGQEASTSQSEAAPATEAPASPQLVQSQADVSSAASDAAIPASVVPEAPKPVDITTPPAIFPSAGSTPNASVDAAQGLAAQVSPAPSTNGSADIAPSATGAEGILGAAVELKPIVPPPPSAGAAVDSVVSNSAASGAAAGATPSYSYDYSSSEFIEREIE